MTLALTSAEPTIVDNGLRFQPNGSSQPSNGYKGSRERRLAYAWFRYHAPGGERTKVVVLRELAYLPREVREDPDILGKQWAAIRGLYNAGIDFVYSTCGIFDRPQGPLGIVQFYGAAAEAASEEAAAAQAQQRVAAVEALLANFPQSRLRPPEAARVEWWVEALSGFPHALALLGMPDPRKSRRGLGDPDTSAYSGAADDELLSQQNELLFRGLAKIREDFVFLTLAQHIRRGVLAQMLEGLSDLTSVYASQQRGVRNIGFSLGLPLLTSLGRADSLAHSTAHGEGHSYAESVGEALSEADSESWATSHSEVQALSKGEFQSQSAGHSSNWSSGRGVARTTNWSSGEAHTESSGRAESHGTADGRAHTESSSHSHTSGSSHSSFSSTSSTQGVSQTSSWATSQTEASGGSQAHTESSSQGQNVGASVGTNHSQTQSSAQGQNVGASVGANHSQTQSSAQGQSAGVTAGGSQSQTTSHSQTGSQANTVGASVGGNASVNAGVSGQVGVPGTGVGANAGGSVGVNAGLNASHTEGAAQTAGQAQTTGNNFSQSAGVSQAQGQAQTQGQSAGFQVGASQTQGQAQTQGQSAGFNVGASQTQGQADAQGQSWSQSQTQQAGGSTTTSSSTTTSHGSSSSSFSSSTHTTGQADTVSHVESQATTESQGVADTESRAIGGSVTHSAFSSSGGGLFASATQGRSVTRTMSQGTIESRGGAHVEGRTESRAQSTGLSAMDGVGRVAGSALSGGFSAGVAPGVSVNRSWQTEEERAMRVTQLLRGLTDVVDIASHEGGFVVDAYLFTRTGRGQEAAASLVPQAFHGPAAAVPTPVMTVAEDADHLRRHALSFQNCGLADPLGALSLSGTRLGSLLTAEMLAAYTAPGVFEEGTALTMQERLPPFALYPDLGGVYLGHQYSPETADLTGTPLRLAETRRFHTVFAGDTGFGKSVAAERLALETTLAWKMRTVVLDFGAGWRKLLNAPELRGRLDFYTLQPGGARPLTWNPLQIGRRIPPEVQWRAFADIFGAVARMGVRRQIGEMRNALRTLYLRAGVLVDDPDLPDDRRQVSADDAAALLAERAARGMSPSAGPGRGSAAYEGQALADLPPWARQTLAVHRSRAVGLSDLYAEIEAKMRKVPPRDVMLRGVLEGILYRLHPLVQGAAAEQYKARPAGGVTIEDLGLPWGLTVIEGGAFLDEFSKAFLLGWLAWHLYTDSVQRRQENIGRNMQPMQIFFEEANKILSGVDAGEEDGGGAAATAQQFETMWRDSRKYGIFLHPLVQSPSLLTDGILSSCANIFAGQLKNPDDRDRLVAALGRSEKGFQDEEWRRFFARLAVGQFVVKLGYSMEMAELEPMLVRPAMVSPSEPTDADVLDLLEGGG